MQQRTKNLLSLAFKLAAFLCGAWGISLNLGISSGGFTLNGLAYYTLQSNVLCAVYFLGAAVHSARHLDEDAPAFLPRWKGAVVMCITVTLLIYHFLLAGGSFTMNGRVDAGNLLVHYIVPVMTILNWLLFDQKGHYKKADPFLWLTAPIMYIVFVAVISQTSFRFYDGSRFPYFFMDIDKLGFGSVAAYIGVLFLFFTALGYIIYAVDCWMGRKKGTAQAA